MFSFIKKITLAGAALLVLGGPFPRVLAQEETPRSADEIEKAIAELKKKIESIKKDPGYLRILLDLEAAEKKYRDFEPQEKEVPGELLAELNELNAALEERTETLGYLHEELGTTSLEKEHTEALEYYNELKEAYEAGQDVSAKEVEDAWTYLVKIGEDLEKLRADARVTALEEDIELIKEAIEEVKGEIEKAQSHLEEKKILKERYEQLSEELVSVQKRLGYHEMETQLSTLKNELERIKLAGASADRIKKVKKEKGKAAGAPAITPAAATPKTEEPGPKMDIRSLLEGVAFAILVFFLLYLIYLTFRKAEKLSL